MISIIVPVFNEADALPELLSHLHGIARGCEVVVVDGASTDDTARIAEREPGVKFVSARRGRGISLRFLSGLLRSGGQGQGAALRQGGRLGTHVHPRG